MLTILKGSKARIINRMALAINVKQVTISILIIKTKIEMGVSLSTALATLKLCRAG